MHVSKTNQLSTAIALLAAGVLSVQHSSGQAPAFQGAEAVIQKITAEPGAGTESLKTNAIELLEKDIAAFKETSATLPPADAAGRWLALAERYLNLSGEDFQSSGGNRRPQFQSVLAALPPPAAWEVIAKGIADKPVEKGKARLRQLALGLVANILTGDKKRQQQDLEDMTALIEKSQSPLRVSLAYVLDELKTATAEASGETNAVLRQFEQQLNQLGSEFSGGYLRVPDLVTLAGEAKARELLRRTLLSDARSISFESGDETQALARKLALEVVNEMKAPRWELAHSVDAVALYEAFDQKFGQAKTNAPGGSLRRQMQMEMKGNNEQEMAKQYYLLGLIVNGRTQDAVAVARSSKVNPSGLYMDHKAMEALVNTGHGGKLFDFFQALLTENPDLPFWNQHLYLAAQTGRTDAMLELARKSASRDGLSAQRRLEIRSHLAKALLAADQVDEGIKELRGLLAVKDQPVGGEEDLQSGMGFTGAVRVSRMDSALSLARLGRLLNRPELATEGLATAKEQLATSLSRRNDYSRRQALDEVVTLLVRMGRGPEAEGLILSALEAERNLKADPMTFAMQKANDTLVLLARVYHSAGRHQDVVTLLDLAPNWGIGDLAQHESQAFFGSNKSAPLPLRFIAAEALVRTGRVEAGKKVLRHLLLQSPGLDAAYALLVELDGQSAVTFLDELYARDQFEERPLIWKAHLLRLAGKLNEAEKTARQAISIDPSDGEQGKGDRMRVYGVLADVFAARNDATQEQFFRGVMKAVRLAEEADDLYEAGLLSRGVKMYRESLGHFADAYCIQSRMAVQLASLGLHQQAENHYRRAYELMPDSFGRVESHCFGCEGVFTGPKAQSIAEGVFASLAAKTPGKPQVHYLLGYLREEQGRYRDALSSYRKAVELDADYLNAWSKISGLADRMSLPAADREAVVLNLLRLDPLRRHSHPDISKVTDLVKLWNALAAAAKFQAAPLKELYALPASQAFLAKEKEKIKGTPMEQHLERRFMGLHDKQEFESPSAQMARVRVLASSSQLLDQTVSRSGFDW